jgi:GTP-binding protein
MAKPLVAIIGRSNVGKSTLFNKIMGKRISIVEDRPGVTRDRLYGDAEWSGRHFTLIDTGGFTTSDNDEILAQVRRQAEIAIETCDYIIFMVDAKSGITAEDQQLALLLRKSGKKVITAANKSDNPQSHDAYEFYNLGLGDVFPISSESGDGVAELLDRLIEEFGEEGEPGESAAINVAVAGRPNAGKSSLVNRLVGFDRSIVTDIAGTTRDATDTLINVGGKEYNIIDTAGIRRKSAIGENVEYYSVMRALAAIKRADVCLVVIDCEAGISEQDIRICGYIHEEGKPSVIVMNKWDKIEKDDKTIYAFEAKLKEKLKFMDYFKSIYVSALYGAKQEKIFALIDHAYRQSCFKATTGALNDVIAHAVAAAEPPTYKGKKLNIYYAAQVNIKPPTFILYVNDYKLLHFSYKRYLENSLRSAFSLDATPIRIVVKNKE